MEKEENKTGKYLEDIALYQYADVAARMHSNEQTQQFAVGALEKLVSDFEKVLGDKKDIIQGFKAGALATQEGVQIATGIYAGQYKKALEGLNFSEFYDLRLKQLTSILGKEKAEKAKEAFAKYEGQTLGSVIKEYEQAEAILKDKTGLFDEKKKKEAKETKEKWQYLHNIVNSVELWNYFELLPGAAKSVFKNSLSESIDKIA
jgi:hypothetical protein